MRCGNEIIKVPLQKLRLFLLLCLIKNPTPPACSKSCSPSFGGITAVCFGARHLVVAHRRAVLLFVLRCSRCIHRQLEADRLCIIIILASCLFGGTASGDAAAATVVGASYSAFSCARALGGGDDAVHAGARALELCTCGTSLNLMCCFMRVGEFGTARGRAQSTQSNL